MESKRSVPTAVLDSNVLIAAVRPDVGHVERDEAQACLRLMDAIGRGDVEGYAVAPILSEVIHVLARDGIPAAQRAILVGRWQSRAGRLEIVPLTEDLAVRAGEYRQAHYHRERLPLSYIDCFCAVLAQQLNDPLITLEEPLRRAPGVNAVTPARFLADHGL